MLHNEAWELLVRGYEAAHDAEGIAKAYSVSQRIVYRLVSQKRKTGSAGREGLKELGKTGKEIEELTGVRQNRASEIWTAYQREGSASLERKKYGRKPGSHMVLTPEEQENIRKAIVDNVPEDFGITGRLWTLGRMREYIRKEFHKTINERTLSDYMKRWGMSCRRPAKRARKQNPQGI